MEEIKKEAGTSKENTATDTGASTSQETNATEVATEQPFKVFNNEEDFKKELQSISSKAKFEILKEFEAKSVDDIKARVAKADELQKTIEELNTGKQSLESELEKIKAEKEQITQEFTLKTLKVNEELQKEFLAIVNITEGDSFEAKCKAVIAKMPYFAGGEKNPVKIGNEKSNQKITIQDRIKERSKNGLVF